MILKLDTTNKQITIESYVKMKELIEELERLFPDGSWKEFTITPNITFYTYPTYPSYPIFPTYTLHGNITK